MDISCDSMGNYLGMSNTKAPRPALLVHQQRYAGLLQHLGPDTRFFAGEFGS
jgi:hypothetical protein